MHLRGTTRPRFYVLERRGRRGAGRALLCGSGQRRDTRGRDSVPRGVRPRRGEALVVARTVNEPNVYVRGNYSYLSFAPQPGQTRYTTIAGNTLTGGTVPYAGFDYVSGPKTRVTIDPNIRVRGNGTYAGFEDIDGPIAV